MPAGITFNTSNRTFSGTPTTLGTSTLTITANDGRGGVTSASFTLSVANSAPVAPSIANQTATAGTAWGYTIPAFTDPNGDALSYTVSGLPSWMSFTASTRRLSGTPGPVGSWTITVVASDGTASTSKSFVVSTPNVAPAVANAIGSKSIGRSIAWSFTVPATTFSDANGDALTYSASGMPAGISFNTTTRVFSGTPSTLGTSTVTVTASDGRGGTRSTSFSVSVVNSAPVYAKALPSRIGQQGQSVSWALPAGTFTDANGDTLGYSALVEIPAHKEKFWNAQDAAWDLLWVDAQWVALSNAGLSIAANGTLSGPVRALTVTDAASQTYTFHGYRVQLTAKDPSGASAQGIFSVSINSAPAAPWISNKTIKSAVAWSFTVPAFTDANGDALSYSASGLPAGLAFNTSTRVISGTPTTAGTYTAKITANDGRGGVTNSSFTITVQANTAPTAPVIPNQSATTGIAFSYLVPAFSDANGDPLTYSATGLPPGLSMSFRTISGTPTTAGSYTVTVTAKDGRGGTVSKAFTITVVNQPPPNRAPVVSTPLPDKWTLGTNYFNWTFPVGTFTDPDNNPLTYTASGQPSWLQFDAVNRRFYGAPSDGRYTQNWTITVTARDPAGLTVSDAFNLMKEGTGGGGTQPFAVEPPQGDPEYSFELDATPATSIPYQVVEHWYSYDAENRLKVNHGKLVNGQIVVDAGNNESHELLYDAAGRVVARYRELSDGGYVYRSAYNLRGEKTLEFHPEKIGAAPRGIGKGFSYYANGSLKETRSYYAAGTTRDMGNDHEGEPRGTLDISGWLSGAEQLQYDRDGRMLQQVTKQRTTSNWYELANGYGNGSNANQRTDLAVLEDRSAVYYSTATGGSGSGYDAAGRATTYRYRGADIGWATHTYTTTYEGWGSYQEKTVLGSSDNSTYRTTNNTLTYDAMGRLSSQREHTTGSPVDIDDRMRYYAYNGEGRVQMRRAGTMDGTTFVQEADNLGRKDNALFVHAGGQQQAELKEGGKLQRTDGSMYYSDQLVSLGGRGNFSAGGGKVAVQAGETLSSLAQRIYGSSQRWYVLADANGLSDPEKVLTAGTQLNAPNVNVSSNDAGTFKPYNPGDAIGSTSPGLPFIEPPPQNQCSAIAMILIIVVAVVVTVFTAGAAAMAMGAVASGAMSAGVAVLGGAYGFGVGVAAAAFAGGVAGSVASQAVASALGVGSFSWKAALVSGATAAATAGISGAAQAGRLTSALAGTGKAATAGRAAASAAAGQATSYGASRALGLEASFSWKSIAASAVGAALTANIGGVPVTEGGASTGKLINDLAGGLVRGAITSTTRRVLGLGKQDWRQIGIDAFGNALGNAAVGGIQNWQAGRAEQRQAELEGGLSRSSAAMQAALDARSAESTAGLMDKIHANLMQGMDEKTQHGLDQQLAAGNAQIDRDFDRAWAAEGRAKAAALARAKAVGQESDHIALMAVMDRYPMYDVAAKINSQPARRNYGYVDNRPRNEPILFGALKNDNPTFALKGAVELFKSEGGLGFENTQTLLQERTELLDGYLFLSPQEWVGHHKVDISYRRDATSASGSAQVQLEANRTLFTLDASHEQWGDARLSGGSYFALDGELGGKTSSDGVQYVSKLQASGALLAFFGEYSNQTSSEWGRAEVKMKLRMDFLGARAKVGTGTTVPLTLGGGAMVSPYGEVKATVQPNWLYINHRAQKALDYMWSRPPQPAPGG